ncbi:MULTISPECIES: lysine N(6)-hydroxylase/L-ornithine N(5)-oxygenase family protein [unclassified Parafrankia]|uniref:lysine N(6)-hydroxylase/L-ornithine N(5)-oxygenase family protein n=1 Tax=Parafrankia TaxID=2994362 RepID=UPI000DA5B8FF|nr:MULTISPECIES: SidA/IucD/PvdA family monooxygenase [unclassified Parafrankia]TCJ32446.1 L-lysine 6-monooxygenase [Parafrankia sp. BMG5.11]CAI7975791.1 L-ornithine N5-monooxygenase [Frankia sp. Hr75.2]SQD99706.1 L-lysine 6-monooxygenase (NADPH) [Parafrankia sp. Ea1.12]
MVDRPPTAELGVHDIIGVGFGPSNIALAIAVEEHNSSVSAGAALRAVFLERQVRFGWHRGMLLDGATMQVSYLKDLVTLRNPSSSFTFLSFLHSRNRLVDFINHKTMYPLRSEYHDYLEWAAGRLDDLVEYDTEVVDLRPVTHEGEIAYVDVISRHRGDPDRTVVRRARNVVIAAGLEPRLPDGVEIDDRTWHNHELLHRLARMPSTPRGRFVVVGAGQSAAEVTEHLHTRFPQAEVFSVFSRYGFSPADNSGFVNQIFDPDAVDEFYHAPESVRAMLLGYHRGTNYSAVDMDLIDELYRRAYQEKVRGPRRLHFLRASRAESFEKLSDGVRVHIRYLPTGEKRTVDADTVVLATGYHARDPRRLLGGLAEACLTAEDGQLQVGRDYSVDTVAGTTAGVYVPGASEYSHGISSSLLSNISVRAGEILTSVLDRQELEVPLATVPSGISGSRYLDPQPNAQPQS